jgi:hypothetical protein
MVNLKYAEILYTLGNHGGAGAGNENYYMARKYYSHCLVLKDGDYTRALWGLL